MEIRINGRKLYVEDHGPEDGPALVLLHQGLGAVRSWREQTPVLAEAGYRVIVYDRWGYGGSDPRPSLSQPFFEDDLNDLSALLDYLKVERLSMIGHSDGGTIALYFAARHPEMIVSLVTIAAHVYIEEKMKPGIDGLKEIYETDSKFRQKLQRAHGEKWKQVFRNWYDGWLREDILAWDMRFLLKDIRCPVLVVQGLEDEHGTPRHAQDVSLAIPNAQLWLVPGAGHLLQQEDADIFNERLLEFLKSRVMESGSER